MARAPEYVVRIREATTNFAPGPVVADLENVKNLGHSEYLNDVGEAFFTLTQGDPKLAIVTGLLDGVGHVEIYRDGTLVWAGWLGEDDETETDIVTYAYSYVAGLFLMHTDWNVKWSGAQVNTIVSDSWTRAKTTLSDSLMAWMATGTIEAPVTTSGGAIPIILPEYHVNYKRLLFVMQELAGMSASDTTNRVTFEVTPAGQFNFWKNKGTSRTDQLWEYGGSVLGYRRIRTPMDSRNTIFGVGAAPRDIIIRNTQQNTTNRASRGRREEAVFYSWVRDSDEVERVTRLRLKRALREDNQLMLSFKPGRVAPARSADADYALADMMPVKISHGGTIIDAEKLVTGQQIILARGVEHVRAIVQDSL